jgi:uncharacterized protein (DUF2252 family)
LPNARADGTESWPTTPTVGEREERGVEARATVPWASHAEWRASPGRESPVSIVTAQNADRLAMLVPIRHHRMLASAFTFYRGAAAIMASDLADTPDSGIQVQICGDAHLSNFGVYASPERSLVFDVNDFDETLPGPWEWDVKRLAASFVIAGRNNGLREESNQSLARESVIAYGAAMKDFAGMPTLDVWYSRLTPSALKKFAATKGEKKAIDKALSKARQRTSLKSLSKLAAETNGEFKIVSQPPVVIPLRDAAFLIAPSEVEEVVRVTLADYLSSLPPGRKTLVSRYRVVDVAHKIVGVGSVGTRCLIALMVGRDWDDPLFLQAKQATSSVLESFLPPSTLGHHGRRVVEGQRLMQAVSDEFLGWATGPEGRQYYFRQLRDMKGSAEVDRLDIEELTDYARICGWTLARSHARSGDPVAINAYLGTGGEFADAVTEFSHRYAKQNDSDFSEFQQASADGVVATAEG